MNSIDATPTPWWTWPWNATANAGSSPWFGIAPQQLTQPINPGWTFGNLIQVTNENSSAPMVEKEVVSAHSYGRQIGRLMDAVVAIADKIGAADDPRVEPLIALAAEIEAIKQEARQRRRTELLDELKALKRSDPKAWSELVKSVGR